MSTAMISQQPATVPIPTPPIAAAPASASPVKKRRRRAPATGAAEDCFSCRDIGAKCDRRRPYCGPCLDNNKECKGYRTQLTWGVGVASRGKLRGMSLPVTTAQLEQRRINDSKTSKQRAEDKALSAEERAKKNRTTGAGTPGYGGGIRNNSTSSNSGKLSIITNYDFVNMEPPSAAASSAVSRTTSALSATPASAISTNSPALSAVSSRSGLPSQRIKQESRVKQESRSPQPAVASPYSAPPYHSPVVAQTSRPSPQPQQHHSVPPPPQQQQQPQQQQHYQTSPAPNSQYHKSPYSHVTLPPQQPSPSMLLSPMSEYEPNFPNHQHYPMSSPPVSAPLYDLVTGVSSASYHPSPSMTVTSSGVSYAPLSAPLHPPSRMMNNDHMHHPQHHQHHHGHQSHHSWSGPHVNVSNMHHHPQQGPLSDLLYDEDMLGQY